MTPMGSELRSGGAKADLALFMEPLRPKLDELRIKTTEPWDTVLRSSFDIRCGQGTGTRRVLRAFARRSGCSSGGGHKTQL